MLAILANDWELDSEMTVVIWTDETDWSIPGDEDDASRWEDDGGH